MTGNGCTASSSSIASGSSAIDLGMQLMRRPSDQPEATHPSTGCRDQEFLEIEAEERCSPMLPESTEGRLRQAPSRRVPGMDIACIRPRPVRRRLYLRLTTTGLSVSPFTGLRAPNIVELS